MTLYSSYTESVPRHCLMAWLPHIKKSHVKRLDVALNRAVRRAIGLSRQTMLEILRFEAEVNSIELLAYRCAVSLYCQINPASPSTDSLAKTMFNQTTPKWAQEYLHKVPPNIWEGEIQPQNQVILSCDTVHVELESLTNQLETGKIEDNYDLILYTDASVSLESDPPGKAAIGYIWFKRTTDDQWEDLAQESVLIGNFHSSYSAEGIALAEALSHAPTEQTATRKLAIFTDSKSNLLTIDKGSTTSPEQIKLFKALETLEFQIDMYHVQSHVGITRNEQVDKLCSLTRTDTNRATRIQDGYRTKKQIKERMKEWTRDIRKDRLVKAPKRGNNTGESKDHALSIYKELKCPPKWHKDLPRQVGVLLSKARSNNWTKCYDFQFKIGEEANARCRKCNDPDTVTHVLDKCEIFEDKRQILLCKLKHKYHSITEMLCSENRQELELLGAFLLDVHAAKDEEIKNGKVT